MVFICRRCNQDFKVKSHLKAHLLRKNPCDYIENDFDRNELLKELYDRKLNSKTYDCEYCHKKFNSAAGKCQHKKICKNQQSNKTSNSDIKLITLEHLQKQIDELFKNKHNVTNITNNNTINITINNFCKNENTEYLDDQILFDCFKNMDLIKLLEEIHCNPEHPENINVRIKNVKMNLMEYYNDGKWIVDNKKIILPKMIRNGSKIMKNYREENATYLRNELDNDYWTAYIWLTELYEEDKTLFNQIKQQIYNLLISKKNKSI